ncbi:MAG TPA: hypothetical protein PLT76_02895 [Candidatus Omnitrophota bacterium]|nr:hypothetical protein [Candidatus Omnitrophota bacterium]HPB68781.1 hypothetical protein [Candidatus Omnitrophota bacterium]HQO57654.1 hypothetical protein [Candidatus Omnitrophota bacterium]
MKQDLKLYSGMVWAEIVISAVIFFYSLPVFVRAGMAPVAAVSIRDWFLLSCFIASVFVLAVAVFTLMGNTMWRFLHGVVAGMTAVMNAALLIMVFRTQSPFQGYYLIPLAVAALVSGYLLKIKKEIMVEGVIRQGKRTPGGAHDKG